MRMILRQHGFGQCVEQRPLVPEVPVKRRLLNPQPFRQFACRQTVYADLVQQVQGGTDHCIGCNFVMLDTLSLINIICPPTYQ